MENASKALIMAGAILIAILVISLGLKAFNTMRRSVENNSNLTKEEIAAFNSQITPYIGESVVGSQVKALYTRVNSINYDSINKGTTSKSISMYLGNEGDKSKPIIQLKTVGEDTTVTGSGVSSISTLKYYKVKPAYSDGLINEIFISEN